MASTLLFGILAATRIGVSQYPDVDYPNITVSLSWPGASPSAVEREVIEPLEQALSQVEGVQQMTSQARKGNARITLAFDISRDVDLALQDVQAKTARTQSQLPADVPAATVSKANPDDTPILTVGVSGPFARQKLADVARYQVQERLQTVAGVGQISLSGYTNRNVRVWLDASRMAEKGVAVTDVLSAIRRDHVDLPGGQLDAGGRQINVRLLGESLDLDTFRSISIRRVNGVVIRLSDVAMVEDGFEDKNSIAQLDGLPFQALGVLKQRGTNAVAVATAVRERVEEIQKELPAGMKVSILFDSTTFIQESVHEIEIELALALALTALVCWLFLGSFSSTLNVLLAIPMSLLGTVGVIYFLGFTLNTFTLLALSLSVGLVVDDAVMVLENIHRHAEMGKGKRLAAADGTHEITFAALAATLAVVAIFLPVIFMSGIIGRFFFQFGVTLSIAVLLSYLEAITLAPARCAQLLEVGSHNRNWLGRLADRGFNALERGYAWSLERGLRHPWKVLFVALSVTGFAAWVATTLPVEFVPTQDQSRLNVRLMTDSGSSLEVAEPILAEAAARIKAQPEIQRTMATLSGGMGMMQLTLVPPSKRSLSAQQLAAKLRQELSDIPGLRAFIQDPSQQSFGAGRSSPIDLTVRGPDWNVLVEEAMALKEKIEASGATTDLSTDYQVGSPEVQVTPDRLQASKLGVSISDLASTINALIGGSSVGKFETGGRRIDIRARLRLADRSRPEDISALRVRAKGGELIPIGLLVKQEEKPTLQAITRVDRERAIRLFGNIPAGKSQTAAIKTIERLGQDLPIGYRVVFGGQSNQLRETVESVLFALVVGILVAYMVLASQFNSFLHPVTVLTILPLALGGAAFGLFTASASLNLFSMIGLLLLMGLVKKNSILLVEYANQLREHESLDAHEAMRKAGPLRLRPILMTTVATMMSAVPAALGLGPGAETRGPMAAAVLGGLAVSTLMSLLVVPAFYLLSDRLKLRLHAPATGARPEGQES